MSRLFSIGFVAVALAVALSGAASAQTPVTGAQATTLQQQIQEKAAALQQLQAQRDALERSLAEISKSGTSLKNEIRSIENNISQLNVSIKDSSLTIDLLKLQVNQLGRDQQDISQKIKNKQAALKEVFLQMQQFDQDSLLAIVFRRGTFSEQAAELQRLVSLNESFRSGIEELSNLQTELADKQTEAKQKQKQQEQAYVTLISRQSIVKDQKEEKEELLVQTKNQEQIFQTQISAVEQMQIDIANEVEKIESVLRGTIDANLLPIARKLFAWPVDGGTFSQDYGATKFAKTAYKSKYHNGVDIAAPIGTEVYAAESGRVINVGDQDKYCPKGAYGKFVVIKHDNGLTTLYGHLSKYNVSIGTRVERGQLIGYIGKTGYATGPHLHFTVFASQTLTPARVGYPEGAQPSKSCGPMPVGGDLDPNLYL